MTGTCGPVTANSRPSPPPPALPGAPGSTSAAAAPAKPAPAPNGSAPLQRAGIPSPVAPSTHRPFVIPAKAGTHARPMRTTRPKHPKLSSRALCPGPMSQQSQMLAGAIRTRSTRHRAIRPAARWVPGTRPGMTAGGVALSRFVRPPNASLEQRDEVGMRSQIASHPPSASHSSAQASNTSAR